MVKLVLIDASINKYVAYVGRTKILAVTASRPLTAAEVEEFRVYPHTDDDEPTMKA